MSKIHSMEILSAGDLAECLSLRQSDLTFKVFVLLGQLLALTRRLLKIQSATSQKTRRGTALSLTLSSLISVIQHHSLRFPTTTSMLLLSLLQEQSISLACFLTKLHQLLTPSTTQWKSIVITLVPQTLCLGQRTMSAIARRTTKLANTRCRKTQGCGGPYQEHLLLRNT